MTKKETILCNGIIHAASTSAAVVGAGLAQVPGSDSTIITPIQVAMTISLGQVFGLDLLVSEAESAVAGALGATVGRMVSQVLIGWIPGVGNTINAATAATLTEVIGWIIAKDFYKQSLENKDK